MMLHIKRDLPAVDAAGNPDPKRGIEHFVITDAAGLAEYGDKISAKGRARVTRNAGWHGNETIDECAQKVRNGDLSAVAASDKLLSELEHLVPVSRAYRVFDNVTGAVPNVPNFIVGNPYNMRQRRRITKTTAPLAIFVELTASAGIKAEDCQKRGAAMLALVRLLTNVRPVELWAITAIGNAARKGQPAIRTTLATKIDTSPLDLARAAYILTSTCVFRGIGYKGMVDSFFRGDEDTGALGAWTGDWAFGSHSYHVSTAAASYKRVIEPGSEALFVPPVHLNDAYMQEPVKWLHKMLAEHGGIAMEDQTQ